jgi:predicted ATPase/DNA-binding SARP family transcriptional activator
MEICLLGSLDVVDDDGRTVTLAGARLRSLLTILALHCGAVVSDDVLIEAVWADGAPANSANALQRQISTLRRALGTPELIERRGSGYTLTLDPSSVDVLRFDKLAARGLEALRRDEATIARELLDDALRLWRGDALADVAYAEFAQPELARLREARAVVLEARIDADLALGRDAELIGELEQAVLQHPLREHLRAQLMLALARAGRPADALRTYQDARRVLGEELGLEPSAELRALETAILREDEGVARPASDNTPARPTTNLRAPLTNIIGRAQELDLLRARLDEHRLVTLVGPGGVGKSRVAVEGAHGWLQSHEGEVWMVELADVDRSDDVVPAIMRSIELPRADNRSADTRRLFDYMCGHSVLLILDNCEHVIGAVARVVHDLLESCPRLRICATSREGLAVPSEVLVPIPPLALSDAVALFVERARAADTSFESIADTPPLQESVAEVCTRVDGLPLAIELAAARLRAMSMTELVKGLDNRFRVLNRGARTALPRQQTLRAVVDWSYDLLFDDERRVFERLSVFRGTCSLAAARVVCADENISSDDVAELVGRLVDKSLVLAQRDPDDGYIRCHMLQTLVEYGRDRLEESGEAARVHHAHIAYFGDFASRSLAALGGVKQRAWLRAVTANLANLRTALEVSVADDDAETAYRIAGCLGWYWWFTGRTLEGSQWLAAARSSLGPVEELTRARALAWTTFTDAPGFVGWAETRSSSSFDDEHLTPRLTLEELDDLCDEALREYRRHPEAAEELAGIELALSVSYSTLGDFPRVWELVGEAERLLGAIVNGSPETRAIHAFARARGAFVADDDEAAEDAFRASAALFASCGVDVYETFALRYQARLAILRGDTQSAIDALERAITVARRLGLGGLANTLRGDLAQAFAARGDFDRARVILTALLDAAREVGFLPGISESLVALAVVEWRAGADERAAEYAREGAVVATQIEHSEAAVYCDAVLGFAAVARKEPEYAREQLRRALNGAHSLPLPARALAFVLEGHATVTVTTDAIGAARCLGAADSLRRASGRASGFAFAVGAIGADNLARQLSTLVPRDEVTAAFDEGAAEAPLVIAALLSGDNP